MVRTVVATIALGYVAAASAFMTGGPCICPPARRVLTAYRLPCASPPRGHRLHVLQRCARRPPAHALRTDSREEETARPGCQNIIMVCLGSHAVPDSMRGVKRVSSLILLPQH